MLSAACTPHLQPVFDVSTPELKFPVVIERRSHPFPFRTRQLSSASPMILRGQLRGKVGRRRDYYERPSSNRGPFAFHPSLPVYSGPMTAATPQPDPRKAV